MLAFLSRVFGVIGFLVVALGGAALYFGLPLLPEGGKKPPGIPIVLLEDIAQEPWAYHEKIVRVRGIFGECGYYSCDICSSIEAREQDTDDDTCMGVSFSAPSFYPNESEEGEELQELFRRSGEYETEELVQYSDVTIEARYHAECSGVPEGKKRGDPLPPSKPGILDEVIICLHRAPQFKTSRIVQIHRWFRGRRFAADSFGGNGLVPATTTQADQIREAFEKSLRSDFDKSELGDSFVFLVAEETDRDSDGEESQEGGICWCRLDECSDGDWPLMRAHAWDRIANPYECYFAERAGTGWRFYLQ